MVVNQRLVCPHAEYILVAGPGDVYTVQNHSHGGYIFLVHTNENPPAPAAETPPGAQKLMSVDENPMLQATGTLEPGEFLYAWAWIIDPGAGGGLALSVTKRTSNA